MRIFKPRDCHTCSSIFTPSGPLNVWCSELCRMLDCCDHSGGDDTCWDWKLGLDKGGYGHGNFEKEKAAHRAMYRAFYNFDLTPDHIVRHKCDRRICINPSHLEIGTHADNIDDMWKRGRQQDYKNALVGSEHPSAKIDEQTALAIFTIEGYSCVDIALKFGVSISIVERIRRGDAWTHVTGKVRGSVRRHLAVITVEIALDIFHSTGTQNAIAEKFNVSVGTVQRIQSGQAWEHVTGAIHTPGRRSGERSPRSKISSEEALAIYNSTDRPEVLGARYGISSAAVGHIRNGKAWRSVTQQ